MATSIVFDLIDALVSTLTDALTDTQVYDGTGASDDPGDYLMIGVSDPDASPPQAFETRQEWAGLGANSRNEEGTVNCAALSWNGDASAKTARLGVKTITQAVEDTLRADPNLGAAVPGLLWVEYGTDGRADLIEATDGTALLWRFDIKYRARI